MQLSFTKMNGAGNDFIMLDNRDGQLSLDASRIARLCDRHRGVGADGILAVETSVARGGLRMRYYNADGGEAEMCGNGARCFARFARRFGADKERLSFETQAGIIRASFPDDEVCVAMSDPHSLRQPASLEINGNPLEVHFINTGVPHAVVFSDNVETVDVLKGRRYDSLPSRIRAQGDQREFCRRSSRPTQLRFAPTSGASKARRSLAAQGYAPLLCFTMFAQMRHLPSA